MLSIFASRKIAPEVEAIDRDPGIFAFVTALVGMARRAGRSFAASWNASRRYANEAELYSSVTAWPYNRRAK